MVNVRSDAAVLWWSEGHRLKYIHVQGAGAREGAKQWKHQAWVEFLGQKLAR